jgi:asparagine synthase (glutamine-hydrolysing)
VWARQDLQRDMDALLSDPQAARNVGLQGDSVRTLWQSFLAGRTGLYWSRIWALYILLLWCQTHELSLDQ